MASFVVASTIKLLLSPNLYSHQLPPRGRAHRASPPFSPSLADDLPTSGTAGMALGEPGRFHRFLQCLHSWWSSESASQDTMLQVCMVLRYGLMNPMPRPPRETLADRVPQVRYHDPWPLQECGIACKTWRSIRTPGPGLRLDIAGPYSWWIPSGQRWSSAAQIWIGTTQDGELERVQPWRMAICCISKTPRACCGPV